MRPYIGSTTYQPSFTRESVDGKLPPVPRVVPCSSLNCPKKSPPPPPRIVNFGLGSIPGVFPELKRVVSSPVQLCANTHAVHSAICGSFSGSFPFDLADSSPISACCVGAS
jgi:hypothetical protein